MTVPDASAELAALRGVLAAITVAFEAVIEEADRPKGGMGATFFEDFSAAARQPDLVRPMRRWVRDMRGVLDKDPDKVAFWAEARSVAESSLNVRAVDLAAKAPVTTKAADPIDELLDNLGFEVKPPAR